MRHFPILLFILLFTSTSLLAQNPQVTLFFSTTCPICEAHTKTIREFSEKWEEKVDVRLIFIKYDSRKDARAYKRKYELTQRSKVDRKAKWQARYGPTHTPEVFLEDGEGKVVYQGRINNLYESLGVRRGVVTERYLDDAVTALLEGKPIPVAKTPPIGCLLEKVRRAD